MKHKAAAFLLILGLLAMAGDVAGIGWLKGFGAATAASPAPKVFSAVKGYETYSTRFVLEWEGGGFELTPEVYERLRGPYNRRNVYGAALAYGPVLYADDRTREMFLSVARYALAGDAPLLRELGVDPGGRVRVRYVPRPGAGSPGVIEVDPR